MKASSASTCLVRSGLRAVGSSAPGTDILPAENWCIPSEPSVRAFGTTVGYPLGETLPCSACGKSHWWQTGQWRLEGYSFFWKIRDTHGCFLPWNWLAQSGDTQLLNSMHAGLRICLEGAHRLTVQAAELKLCTRVDAAQLKLKFHNRKQTKLRVIKRSQELSNFPWRW